MYLILRLQTMFFIGGGMAMLSRLRALPQAGLQFFDPHSSQSMTPCTRCI